MSDFNVKNFVALLIRNQLLCMLCLSLGSRMADMLCSNCLSSGGRMAEAPSFKEELIILKWLNKVTIVSQMDGV